jgi:hypothetical protein
MVATGTVDRDDIGGCAMKAIRSTILERVVDVACVKVGGVWRESNTNCHLRVRTVPLYKD